MDFAQFGDWLGGGVTIVGLLQWIKGMVPEGIKVPSWVWGLAAAVLASGWAVAPLWARAAAGVLAISQIGYETIIQTIKHKLGGVTQ